MAISKDNTYLLGKDVKTTYNFQTENIELAVDSNGDIAETDFLSNAIYSIDRRLISQSEELILHPDYGGFASNFVSELNNSVFTNIMLIMLRQELYKDPRVKEVLNVSIRGKTSQVYIYYNVLLINEQTASNTVFVPVG